jgi:hypothetical protein
MNEKSFSAKYFGNIRQLLLAANPFVKGYLKDTEFRE